VIAAVAYAYHFPPAELWEMDFAELLFWNTQGNAIMERVNRG